jgi:hypothetical protein
MDKHKLSLLALAVLGMGAAVAGDDDVRELSGTVEAKALQALRIEAHVGHVDIKVSAKDQINWRLRLEPDDDDGWFSGSKDAKRAVSEAKVKAVATGNRFEIELELPRGTDFDDVEEHWEIEVPARFAIDVEANVGQVELTGMTGGIEAELNVGELRIDVPSGRVDARLNVGELKILSATKSPGEIRLSANIGDVDLRVGGKRFQAERGIGLGGGVSASNGGKDDVTAKVNVGEVTVRID